MQYASKTRYVRSVTALCETYFTLLALRYVKSGAQMHSVGSTLPFYPCWSFLNHTPLTSTPAPLCVVSTRSCLSHVGGHSTLQRGSGGRAGHYHDRDSGYTESPVKLRRLTKGVSISLPSSPLLPRQADIVPSQSCIKFTGGFSWNSDKTKKRGLNVNNWEWQEVVHRGIAAKNSRMPFMALPWLAESLCAFSCSIHVTANTRAYRLCPQGPKPCDRLPE